MPSVVPGFEYDIFISYRHNDNRSGWVTDFVNALQEELAATIKEPLSIYFDKNPHDGLLETHNVDKSLEGKLRCLIFIPIISQTYCDPKSFAWQHEFCRFNKLAKEDQFGKDIRLINGNVSSRILPIKIHDLDNEDKSIIENEIGGALRAIEFIFKSAGVNRPLRVAEDHPQDNLNKTFYRDQINKTANAIKEIISALKTAGTHPAQTIHDTQLVTNKAPTSKLLLVSIALVIIMVAGYFVYQQQSTNPEQFTTEKSIAVLPFENMSNDPEQEYFIDGISEEILNTLVKIRDLKVAGRTSSFQYKGKNEDIKVIGKKLGVSYVLEGSVRKMNDEVRITAQLINADNGFHLWSEEYIGSINDIFKFQDRVSLDIARSVSNKLEMSGELNPRKNRNVNPIAYDLYLKARQLFMKRENFKETERLFRLSLKADSTFDLAYSGLAASIQFIISYGNGDSTTNVLANKEATYYAKRALLLDSLNAEAYSVLGLLHDFRNELLQARLFHEKSLKINPTISTANLWYGQHLYQVGHFTEAHAFVEKAANQEPLYGINHIWLAQIDVALMNIDEGLEHARKAKNSGIGFWGEYVVMSLFMESGQWASLEKFINDNPDLTSDWKAEFLKWVNYSRNKSKQLAPWIKEDVSIPERLPEVYYWSGNYEKAIQIINRYGVVGQALFQGRKELRKHPGFKTAAIKFGYLDYWKRYGGPDFCPDIIKNNLECN